MPRGIPRSTRSASALAGTVFAAASLAASGAALAAATCQGPGATSGTQTTCVTAINLPKTANGVPTQPIISYDISWVNPQRGEYYLADRLNAGIIVISTETLKFTRIIPGFTGAVINSKTNAVTTALSGPNGVVSHGRWLYVGDGPCNTSTQKCTNSGVSNLQVVDLDAKPAPKIVQTVSSGGSKRVDELAASTDGKFVFGANNADDPAFGTLFAANGDKRSSNVSVAAGPIFVDPNIVPVGFGLGIEQPSWEPFTARFYTSVPIIKDNPPGCNFGQLAGNITCQGGLAILDPANPPADGFLHAYDPTSNTGVLPLDECAPNGSTVGPNANLLLGCTPQNNPSNTKSFVINAVNNFQFVNIGNITGSDEVYFNAGDDRYYLGASRNCGISSGCPNGGAALGVVDGASNLVIEAVPQSSGSHSVAADSLRNLIFVPQSAPASVHPIPTGGDGTTVGELLCGGTNGCIAVFANMGNLDD